MLAVVSLVRLECVWSKKYLSRRPTKARANWTFVELPSERIPAPPRAYRVINRVRVHRPFACTTFSSTRFFIPPPFSTKASYARSGPPSDLSRFVVFASNRPACLQLAETPFCCFSSRACLRKDIHQCVLPLVVLRQ